MKEKYLPIGTVVLLKGGKKRAMITGFCSVAQENQDKIYDYSGCVYPEGYLSSNQVCLFDHDQIEKIFFVGYEDDEEKSFKDKLNTIVSNLESQAKDEEAVEETTEHESLDETPVSEEVNESLEAPIAISETPVEFGETEALDVPVEPTETLVEAPVVATEETGSSTDEAPIRPFGE